MKRKPEKSVTDFRGYFRVIILFFLFSAKTVFGQKHTIDSLRKIIDVPANDTGYINALNNLAYAYLYSKPDSCYYYASLALELSQKNNYPEGIILSQENIAFTYTISGNYAKSLELLLDALKSSDRIAFTKGKELAFFGLAGVYGFKSDELKSIEYNEMGIREARLLNDSYWVNIGISNTGISYFNLNKLDSAFYWADLAYREYLLTNDRSGIARSLSLLGAIYYEKAIYDSALYYSRQAIPILLQESDDYSIVSAHHNMAEIFLALKKYDSAFYYAMQSLHTARQMNFIGAELSAAEFLVNYHKSRNNTDSVLKYLELTIALKDSTLSQEKNKDFENLTIQENLRQQQIQQAKKQAQEEYAAKFKIYGLLAGLAIFVIVVLFQLRYARQQKASGEKIKQAYNELKSTQSQLIQSEKMASLGQVTAGIAHEIQNPLNFVNNFSEVNTELLQEMNKEIDNGNWDDVKIIARDLQDNEAKINYHGKRADSIVKGMLQHSRSGNGRKEMTDINSLANEFLQLAYRGTRAKNNSFTVNLRTSFDNSIGKINIVPQDIGRVLLNLFSNAFYAVDEKKKTTGDGYEPTVTVTTKKEKNNVSISVADNGNGIPQNIIDKIFQPFFTTKPTGQGTGLGLSLSYDIVKAHGGELKVQTKEHEYSTFIVILPFNTN